MLVKYGNVNYTYRGVMFNIKMYFLLSLLIIYCLKYILLNDSGLVFGVTFGTFGTKNSTHFHQTKEIFWKNIYMCIVYSIIYQKYMLQRVTKKTITKAKNTISFSFFPPYSLFWFGLRYNIPQTKEETHCPS